MQQFKLFIVLASLIVLLSGCGYRLGSEEGVQRLQNSSLSIPYIENDVDGQLTDQLIKTVASSGIFTYATTQGALELRVKILCQDNSCIGWKYNRNRHGKRNKDLVCTEGRRWIEAEVTLLDTLNDDQLLLGPVVIRADLDFDYYEPDSIKDLSFEPVLGKRVTSVDFSLGQLDSTEGAYDASWLPLTRLLSKKILDLILHASYY